MFESIPEDRKEAQLKNAARVAREAEGDAIRAMGHELVAGATENVRTASIGNETERFLEASHAAAWAESLDDPSLPAVPHPGLSPIAYRMSKAVSDEERSALIDGYITDPSTVSLPKDLYTGED